MFPTLHFFTERYSVFKRGLSVYLYILPISNFRNSSNIFESNFNISTYSWYLEKDLENLILT